MKPVLPCSNTPSSRRDFLKGLSAVFALPILAGCDFNQSAKQSAKQNDIFLGAAGGKTGEFSLSWLKGSGRDTGHYQTNFRGHGLTRHPVHPHLVLMFSRRPGNEGVLINTQTNHIEHRFKSPDHLFMEGHGCFSHDGKYLFCTESNRHTLQGIITVRETDTFSVIHEWHSGGIGPHEIQIMPNKNTLVIANGGLIKNSDGKVINVDTMQSNVAMLDHTTGELTANHTVQNTKASLRHLDISEDGIVAVAMQIQDYNSESSSALAKLIYLDGTSTLLDAPPEVLNMMKGYVGSVRINSKFRTAAFTSPRGDIALFWNIDNGHYLGHHLFHNVCGVTINNNEEYFVLSNSAGKIRHINSSTLLENTDLRQHLPHTQWDNHLITASC